MCSLFGLIDFKECLSTHTKNKILNTLKATLQMVNHLVEVAVSMSDTAVQELSWFDFLDDVTEPELIQYLKERRLYVNEPVNTSEEE